jgi:hypothetical protein
VTSASSAAGSSTGSGGSWKRLVTHPTASVTTTPIGTSHCAAMPVGLPATGILTNCTITVITTSVATNARIASSWLALGTSLPSRNAPSSAP